MDEIGAVYLGCTCLLWFFGLVFAAGSITERRTTSFVCMLLARADNSGLILAQHMR